MVEVFLLLIVIQAVVAGSFCSYIAKTKGRGGFNWFLLGFFFSFLALLALIAFPKIEDATKSSVDVKGGGKAAAATRSVAEYEGKQDLALPAYKLFLTRRYSIERNATLEVYSIREEVFSNLDDALRNADERWRKEVAAAEAEAAKQRKAALLREREIAQAREADALSQRARDARVKKILVIGIPVGILAAGAIWILQPRMQEYMDAKAAIREAETQANALIREAENRTQECKKLSGDEANRCLKALRAAESCSSLTGMDSIKCISDFMDR